MLFEQIEANKRKTYLLVTLFTLFTILVGSLASYYLMTDFLIGAIGSVIFMCIYVPIAISQGKRVVLKMNHAKKINHTSEAPHLWNSVEALAIAANIPMPELYIIQEESPNAFATGFSPEKAAIAVTTALLEKLTREEVEAVLAHEMAHIRNYDVRLTTISLALVSIIAMISDIGTRYVFAGIRDNKNAGMVVLALIILILSPFIALVMHFSLSRNREFLADADAVGICRNPHALASALEKITQDKDPVDHVSVSTAGMYFADPLKVRKKPVPLFSKLYETHPPAEERIKRLRQM